MSVVVTIISYDESARPPALPNTEFPAGILIGQVDKVQNSCFKEHLWKVAAKTKNMYFKSMSWSMLTEAPNVMIFVSDFLNIV